ncbi:MAG: hypothetical protein ACJA06_002239 [Halocynthiibacter sp.]|jgi:hypothetical protein
MTTFGQGISPLGSSNFCGREIIYLQLTFTTCVWLNKKIVILKALVAPLSKSLDDQRHPVKG